MGHIPGNGVLKMAKHRANEAESRARDVMVNDYRPGVKTVDERTPILAEPYNPDAKQDDNKPKPPGGTDQGTPTLGDQPESGDPNTQNPNSSDNNSPNTNPASTPTSTTPASTPTNPAGTPNGTGLPDKPKSFLEDPVGRPGAPSGTPSGIPGGATPSPGKSVPGNPAGQPGGAGGAGNRGSKAAAGRPGMPGMGAPGSRGNGNDDENEHGAPDYLIQDRTTELLGVQPRVLPPGGVIGG
jgi:hypothetical protein